MSFAPLFASGPLITVHAFAAMLAFVLGIVQLALAKGGKRHATVGYVWVALMLIVAMTSFWIHEIRLVGAFSPIHALSVITLVGLAAAIVAARNGNIRSHRAGMLWMFYAALVGAGAFTLLPGRDMYHVVFGQ